MIQLGKLCKEIRRFLVRKVSKTGGHLSSNLGVVELTVALHYCFDSPADKIIWDVGHQSYVHKILTGRQEGFKNLRQQGGMSGFPKNAESKHDAFDTGHSSTSISAALGYCIGRDLSGENYRVAAVIGDGSMTGGLAYEALNNAGRSNTDLIVILNDNQMSISENVGALSKYLNRLRTAPSYLGAKKSVHGVLNKLPFVGKRISTAIEKAKSGVKYLLVQGSMFDALGFNYIGPVDGHSIDDMITVLEQVKSMSGPILLHVYTMKGKGYGKAERQPDIFHGIDCFDIKTGRLTDCTAAVTYSKVFGDTMLKLAAVNKKIIAVTAAMTAGCGLSGFAARYPKRLIDVGIAEAHAITFAAGLAKSGFVPVVAIYSTFLQRAYDQILHDVCLQNLHVVFAIDRAGLVGCDGETHQGIFDLSFLTHIPNITIMAPSSKNDLIDMLEYAVELGSPVAVRYPRGAAGDYEMNREPLVHGKWQLVKEGEKVAILYVGSMSRTAFTVHSMLENVGMNAALYNVRFVKPYLYEQLVELSKFNAVFILEENMISGGFGSGLLNKLNEFDIRIEKSYIFGLPDSFIPQGTVEELREKYGLGVNFVYNKIMNVLKDSYYD